MTEHTLRRDFLKKTATIATGATLGWHASGAPTVKPVLGANEKIRMGFIGVGNRGTKLLHRFMANDDVEVVALCDIYEPYLNRDFSQVSPQILKQIGENRVPRMGEQLKVDRYKDFRKLLERKDIDAVCIATPDHWHAIQTIQALEAGKDIYVEKPLTIALREGRKMVEAAAKTDRIVQVGLNRRGSQIYQQLAKEVQNGRIGKVSIAHAYRISNMYPDGIGRRQSQDPPSGFDWDMWLGPRAYRPFQINIAPYSFRWWKDYSTQMGNWGVHYMDAIRWMLGETAPVAINAQGGQYVLNDDRTIPDTMQVTFEFASGVIVNFGVYEANGGSMIASGEIELRGSKGNLIAKQDEYRFFPTGAGQFQERGELIEASEFSLEDEDSSANMIRNFLDCVKSRGKVWCSLEEGHRSTSFAHLANIALEVGQRIQWDPVNEKITNITSANDLLEYEYRKPWSL
jgi:predicted dehydrogenase